MTENEIAELYKKMFPNAIFFDDDMIEFASNLLELSNFKSILCQNKNDIEEVFEMIKGTTYKVLKTILNPFIMSRCETSGKSMNIEDLMNEYHYNYQDLFITVLYHTLEKISYSFVSTTKYKIIKRMDHEQEGFSGKINSYAVENLSKLNKKRNLVHLSHFGIKEELEMRMRNSDIKYYSFLSQNPQIRKFLYNDNIKLNKKYIQHFVNAYDYIDRQNGYDRFRIDYRFECDSQIDFLTHVTYKLYNLYTRKTISKEQVKEILNFVGQLTKPYVYSHNVYCKVCKYSIYTPIKLVYNIYNDFMNHLIESGQNNTYRTVNFCILGLYDMYDYFDRKDISLLDLVNTQNIFNEIGTIIYAASNFVSAYVTKQLMDYYVDSNKEYTQKDIMDLTDEILNYIDKIKYCESSSKLFNESVEKYKDRRDYRLIRNMSSHHLVLNWLNYLYITDEEAYASLEKSLLTRNKGKYKTI